MDLTSFKYEAIGFSLCMHKFPLDALDSSYSPNTRLLGYLVFLNFPSVWKCACFSCVSMLPYVGLVTSLIVPRLSPDEWWSPPCSQGRLCRQATQAAAWGAICLTGRKIEEKKLLNVCIVFWNALSIYSYSKFPMKINSISAHAVHFYCPLSSGNTTSAGAGGEYIKVYL